MEIGGTNRWQWLLLLAAVIAFGAYRTWSSSGPPSGENIAQRESEIQVLWRRVLPFPGAGNPSGAKAADAQRIVYDRIYPAPAGTTYAEARRFYDEVLPSAGWMPIGEQRDLPGFPSPVMIYRNGDYHLLLSAGEQNIRLRITWTPDLNPLADQKIMPD